MTPRDPQAAEEATRFKIIACDALRDEVLQVSDGVEVEFCEAKLHDDADRLRATLNEHIAATPGSRTILLAYGRCCNGTTGLEAGSHRLVLPAVDDCISLLLGSREHYLKEFSQSPGTYYYTRGWIDYISDPYQTYLKLVPKYGEEKARRLSRLELANYTRFALIDTGSYPLEDYEPYVRTVGAFYGIPVEQLSGSLRLLDKLVKGPHDEEFLTIEPGMRLDEKMFWALDSLKA
jgi:hypothetical protein